jgi:exonuclease VII large subunit
VLARGYAIVTAAATGRTITDATQVTPGDELHLRLHRGTLRTGVLARDDADAPS